MSFLEFKGNHMGEHRGKGLHTYANGWKFCGKCGEWRQSTKLLPTNVCPICHFKVRNHSLRGRTRQSRIDKLKRY